MPENVARTFDRSCRDCHSNATRWPWYGQIPPGSWLVARDVERGRKAWNMSTWRQETQAKPAVALARMAAVCASAQSGRMPLRGYRLMHFGSELSPQETQALCGWTKQESQRLLREARRRSSRGTRGASH
jgi:hypothetical protein